jgi:hypothetical protein
MLAELSRPNSEPVITALLAVYVRYYIRHIPDMMDYLILMADNHM